MSEQQHPQVSPPSLELPHVAQTILKWNQPTIAPPQRPPAEPPSVPQLATEAMQGLMAAIAQVRSRHGGASVDAAPTPETLTPYVLEEAADLWDALTCAEPRGNPEPPQATPTPRYTTHPSQTGLILLEELIPQLLWSVVRSSYDLMRAIAGVPGRRIQSGTQTPGMVRLVAGLEASGADWSWFFDLASDRPVQRQAAIATLQGRDIQIQSDAVPLCHQATRKDSLIARVQRHLQNAAPELAHFLEPSAIALLQPGTPWQTARVQLTLDFEFFPDEEGELTAASVEPPPPMSVERDGPPAPRHTTIRIPLAQVAGELTHHAIAEALMGLLSQEEKCKRENPACTPDFHAGLTRLVASACRLLQEQKSRLASVDELGTEDMSLDELLHRLLWQMVRGSYSVMQLVVGVEASVLRSQSHWERGILRLVGILQVTTPALSWQMDVATGEAESTCALPGDAIVYAPQWQGGGEPTIGENLLQGLIEQIQALPPAQELSPTASPLKRLDARLLSLKEIPVELCHSDSSWYGACARLSFHLEFISHPNFPRSED